MQETRDKTTYADNYVGSSPDPFDNLGLGRSSEFRVETTLGVGTEVFPINWTSPDLEVGSKVDAEGVKCQLVNVEDTDGYFVSDEVDEQGG